ncbi:LrgA family protein [Tolumonas auensis DSM 9187]|jgi:Putative effector of murein hydrolase LrgA|uniref:LrgA family protein n=1 Tax=Tolumonas auensis (strain DSM 9187 / NBRC 110442 / TA 4) TaxID=595494 RepID=C4L8T8_TOLAT|nr:CidA/LrgA family protein [Tolumonas auensis]ACQ93808.1 LrgA family protein [Tolumonas auensis DSM 9187]NCB57574.1 murein hydrolase regulator LrgA [Gammaproteobacteria bacterium]
MSAIRYVSHRILRITRDFLVILACLQAGKAIAAVLPFRFPDSILGMLLLFILLNLQLVKLHWIEMGASILLKHMALLFIPVAVGLLGYMDTFMSSLGAIIFNVFLGMVLILLIVGRIFQRMNQ